MFLRRIRAMQRRPRRSSSLPSVRPKNSSSANNDPCFASQLAVERSRVKPIFLVGGRWNRKIGDHRLDRQADRQTERKRDRKEV